jgi:glycosyltransferase involved in cell wall biosynthesis
MTLVKNNPRNSFGIGLACNIQMCAAGDDTIDDDDDDDDDDDEEE